MERVARRRLAGLATILLAVIAAGCGEREEVVTEPQAVSPSPRAEGVIDAFARSTGDELVAVEHDPDALGFPGDADAAELPGAADLLTLDSADGPVTSSARYGSFVLNVTTSPGAFEALASSGAGADGIAWQRLAGEGVDGEQLVTWIAHKRYGDVVLSWRSSERQTDAAFARLDRALTEALVGPKGDGTGEAAPGSG